MFLADGFAVVLMLGSMLPSISEKDYFEDNPMNVDVYAISVDLINEKIFGWYDVDNTGRKTAFPSPIDYDISANIDLPYVALLETLANTHDTETHNVYIDYDVNFLTTNRRINFGYVALTSDYEIDEEIGWQGTSFVNANNVVSNRGYQNTILFGDFDQGENTINWNSYCLGWYCANDTTTTNYADIELNLPYLLRVENANESAQNQFVRTQNNYYTTTYNSYYIEQTTNLRNELDYYMYQYSIALDNIERLSNELENNVGRFIESAFDIIDKVLSIEILPNIKLWYIIGIPLVLSVVKFIIGWFR